MSVTTNVVTKLKQLFYNAGTNDQVVSNAVESIGDMMISVHLPTGSDGNAAAAAANGSLTITSHVDCKLQAAYFATTPALVNASANDVVVSIITNGVTASSYNTNAAAQGAVAANGIATFSTNTVNSYVDAGEVIKVVYTMADNTNNYLNGNLVLQLRRQ